MSTVKQLDACDQRLVVGMPERVSSTISRVEGTTWNARRYQITAAGVVGGGGGLLNKVQLEADSINQNDSSTHVRKHTDISHRKRQLDARLLRHLSQSFRPSVRSVDKHIAPWIKIEL